MSFIQPAAVKAIALSVDVTFLTDDAAKALAPDVEYRLREVIQDALKFAQHSKRTKLTTQDVSNALRMRNIEPLYGFLGSNDPAKFVRATGHPDLYFVRDEIVPLEQITCAALPKPPTHTTIMPHWLFIDGVQPQTEENAAVERPPAKRQRLTAPAGGPAAAGGAAAQQGPDAKRRPGQDAAAGAAGEGGAGAAAGAAGDAAAGMAAGERVALPVQHVLSDEMNRLMDQIKEVLGTVATQGSVSAATGGDGGALWGAFDANGAQQEQQQQQPEGAAAGGAGGWSAPNELAITPMQRAVLTTIQTDPGMQQLMPYLCKYVADEVAGGLRSLPRLRMVLRIVQALVCNQHVSLEPYLAQLMPPLLTCMLAKSLGPGPAADHWSLRDAAAAQVASLCGRFGEPYYSLQLKVCKQLLKALLDGSKPLTAHYGAVAGLAAMGPATVRLLLLPQLEPYLAKLQPALGARGEGVRKHEAMRVYGALLTAAGSAMYDKLLTAAADNLPYHLFQAPRPRVSIPELHGDTQPPPAADANGAAGAGGAKAEPGAAAAAPGPAVDPQMEELWSSVVRSSPGQHVLYLTIRSDPTSTQSVGHLTNMRNIAANPQHKFSKEARAVLYALAKEGISPPAIDAASGASSNGSGGGAVSAAGGSAARGQAAKRGRGRKGRSGDAGTSGGGAEESAQADDEWPPRRVDAALQAGAARVHSGEPARSARAILAEAWREDADWGEVVWALTSVFGPAFLAKLPQPGRLAAMTI